MSPTTLTLNGKTKRLPDWLGTALGSLVVAAMVPGVLLVAFVALALTGTARIKSRIDERRPL